MKYFVCSDIHGFFDEWQQALQEKKFDIKNPNHKIIICGDLFDRGNQPKEIIDYILENKDKIILIRGNHEDLMEAMIERNQSSFNDLMNGTCNTIIDLCPKWRISEFDLSKIAEDTKLKEVMDLCINYYETNKYVFVHAWIPIKSEEPLYDPDWRNADADRWTGARWINPLEMYKRKIFEPEKTIVCGHWHCSAFWNDLDPDNYDEFGDNENHEPFITKNMIAIDACTVHSGKVNVIVLKD